MVEILRSLGERFMQICVSVSECKLHCTLFLFLSLDKDYFIIPLFSGSISFDSPQGMNLNTLFWSFNQVIFSMMECAVCKREREREMKFCLGENETNLWNLSEPIIKSEYMSKRKIWFSNFFLKEEFNRDVIVFYSKINVCRIKKLLFSNYCLILLLLGFIFASVVHLYQLFIVKIDLQPVAIKMSTLLAYSIHWNNSKCQVALYVHFLQR